MSSVFVTKWREARPSEKLALGLALSVFLLCGWAFFELAEDVPEGAYRRLDRLILLGMREPENPAQPIGPTWVAEAVRDVSALGSEAVLALIVTGVVGYLIFSGRKLRAVALLVACGGGAVLNTGLKMIAHRPRPDVVPALTPVTSSSFPSGHSMVSAIVYLTLALLITRGEPRRSARIWVIALAGLIAVAVGISRVYLGVHFPTDVVAGWCAGTAWAIGCVACERWIVWRWPQTMKSLA